MMYNIIISSCLFALGLITESTDATTGGKYIDGIINMIEIPLYDEYSEQHSVKIDDEDIYKINKYKWTLKKNKYTYYVCTYIKGRPLFMHRVITNASKGEICDHINHDGLNNMKSNLRLCTKAENNRNNLKHCKSSSKYKGITYDKKNKKYRAVIWYNYKFIHLGRYINEIDAARAYNLAAEKYHKEFACLNVI